MDKIEITILRKLYIHKKIGGSHTSIDNLPKGFPKQLHKDVLVAAKELIKEGFLLSKPTHYGLEVSLNPRRINDIEKIIGIK